MELVAPHVAARWIAHHGEDARRWLDELPTLVAMREASWEARVTEGLEGGSVSVVMATETRSGPAVLKLAAPWSATSAAEALALSAWHGTGAPRLLRSTEDGSAILMERIIPGVAARGLHPREVVQLLKGLQSTPVPPGLPTTREAVQIRFTRALENRHGLLAQTQFAAARGAALALAAEEDGSPVIVHGDLLSKNILRSDHAGLMAIDPNPFAGDCAFDAALWALTEDPVYDAPLRARALAAGLGVPERRIFRWIEVLAAAEGCLAPIARARATLVLADSLNPSWIHET